MQFEVISELKTTGRTMPVGHVIMFFAIYLIVSLSMWFKVHEPLGFLLASVGVFALYQFRLSYSLFDKFYLWTWLAAGILLLFVALSRSDQREVELNFALIPFYCILFYASLRMYGGKGLLYGALVLLTLNGGIASALDIFNGTGGRLHTIFNPILHGNIAAFLAIFFIFEGINAMQNRKWFQAVLFGGLVIISLITFVTAGSRSPIVFIFIFFALATVIFKFYTQKIFYLFLVSVVALSTVGFYIFDDSVFVKRAKLGVSNSVKYLQGERAVANTSEGLRAEFFRSGTYMIKNSPLLGNSNLDIREQYQVLIDKGELDKGVLRHPHFHSDIIELGVRYGLLGIFVFLLTMGLMVYGVVTSWPFISRTRQIQSFAFIVGILVFGLMDYSYATLSHILILAGSPPIVLGSLRYIVAKAQIEQSHGKV